MLRKRDDHVIEYRCIHGGNGEVEGHKIIECPEELYGKGRLFKIRRAGKGHGDGRALGGQKGRLPLGLRENRGGGKGSCGGKGHAGL